MKFKVNGSIHPSNSNHYFIAPIKSLNHELYEAIHRTQWLFVYGSPGSGKSTLIEQVCQDIRGDGLTAMSLSLNGYKYDEDIWDHMITQLKVKYSNENSFNSLSLFTNSSASYDRLLDLLIKSSRSNNQKVVLFIDDFDQIKSNQSIINNVLHALSGIKADFIDIIQSIVLVGNYGVQYMNTTTGSTYRVSYNIAMPLLTLSSIREMFSKYTSSRSDVTIDDAVVADIFHKTTGHAGLVSIFGKIIDEKIMTLLSLNKHLTIEKWLQLYHSNLSEWLDYDEFALIRPLVDEINNDNKLTDVLFGNERLTNRVKSNEISKLLSLGVLIVIDEGSRLTISSPVMRHILLLKVDCSSNSDKINGKIMDYEM